MNVGCFVSFLVVQAQVCLLLVSDTTRSFASAFKLSTTATGIRTASASTSVTTRATIAASPRRTSSVGAAVTIRMIGGRGWNNNDYLSGLGGDDDDRSKQREEYEEFSERRAKFIDRQSKIMKTPQGQEFLKQHRRKEQQHRSGELKLDEEESYETSGGGTRMGRMMAQAKRTQGTRSSAENVMMDGFEHQLLLGRLDDDDDEEEKE